MRILAIVDDTPDVRRIVRMLLERAGAWVGGEASSITEAVQLIAPHDAGFVILDHHLDGEVLGLDGAAMIQEHAPGARIVLFSALDLTDEASANPHVEAFVGKDRILDLPGVVRALQPQPGNDVAPHDRLLATWLTTPAILFGSLPPPVEAADVLHQLMKPTAERSAVVLRFVAACGDVDVAVAHLLGLRALLERSRDVVVLADRSLLDLLIVEATSNVIAAVRRVALIDPLTGIGNRRALENDLRSALARTERTGQPLSVLYFDLVGLKAINDSEGHEEGDRALKEFAGALLRTKRSGDGAYRVGGDEFVAMLADASPTDASLFANRLETSDPPAFSWGMASTAEEGFDPARLLRLADLRMLQSRYDRFDAVIDLAADAESPNPLRGPN